MWTSVFVIKYLMNIVISLTTVMLMLTVLTPKDHSTALVLMVILVMEWLVWVSLWLSLIVAALQYISFN